MNRRLVIVIAIVMSLVVGYVVGRIALKTSRTKGNSSDAMADILASKELRIGYIVFPPSVSKGSTAVDPTGHMIDAVRYIASEMNVQVKFQEATWTTFAAGLQAKQYDIVVAPLFATPSRATAVSFTKPLFYLGMAIIAKQGETRFNTLNDLNKTNVRIAVNQGGANQRFAKRFCPEAKLTELSTDISQVLSEVVAGRADAAIADTWSVSKFADQNKQSVQVLFSGRPLDITAISWAVRPDDTRLLEFLNTSIDYLHTSGQIREFEKRYDAHWLHLKEEWERD